MIDLPVVWVALAVLVGIVVVRTLRGRRRGYASRSAGSIDVEADLLRACHGDRAMAERLIAHELAQNASLSRTGAALMALAKLRDDRR